MGVYYLVCGYNLKVYIIYQYDKIWTISIKTVGHSDLIWLDFRILNFLFVLQITYFLGCPENASHPVPPSPHGPPSAPKGPKKPWLKAESHCRIKKKAQIGDSTV